MTAAPLPCTGLEALFQPAAEKMGFGRAVPSQRRAVVEAWASAVAICRTCPRRVACLDAELASMRAGLRTLGVHGGTTPPERVAMLDQGRLSPARITAAGFGRAISAIGARPRRPIVHGTHAGYVTHLSRGEVACDACKAAHNAYRQSRRAIAAEARPA